MQHAWALLRISLELLVEGIVWGIYYALPSILMSRALVSCTAKFNDRTLPPGK